FSCQALGLPPQSQLAVIFVAYTLVGVGAAAYSPAKYGIVTEMLAPKDLVKGNSWIEGLTVISIIVGTVVGGLLINPTISEYLLTETWVGSVVETRTEGAILLIGIVYLAAAMTNLAIPRTNVTYPRQERNPVKLISVFWGYV